MADTGGCSANEATSFASVSVAKRLCRIVRVVGHEMAVIITNQKITPLRRLHLIRFTAFSTFSSRRRLPLTVLIRHTLSPFANRTTIKAFSQTGEGAERSEADEGEREII